MIAQFEFHSFYITLIEAGLVQGNYESKGGSVWNPRSGPAECLQLIFESVLNYHYDFQ